jgi:hypothetical protein
MDNTENTPTEPVVEQPAAPEIPAFLKDVDPEKRDAILAKLGRFKEQAVAVSEAAEGAAEEPAKPQGEVVSGKDVDWSEYELDYSVKHLYPEARYQNTPQGPRWVAQIDEFFSTERDFGSFNKRIKNDTEFLNLGQFLNDMLNSPEGWKLISVLPSGTGRAGVLMQRVVPVILPDPIPLKTETEVAVPTDAELANVQTAADDFAAEVGGAEAVASETPEVQQ